MQTVSRSLTPWRASSGHKLSTNRFLKAEESGGIRSEHMMLQPFVDVYQKEAGICMLVVMAVDLFR